MKNLGGRRLAGAIEDAHALETEAVEILKALAETARDPQLTAALEEHRAETAKIRVRLETALASLGLSASGRKERRAFVNATVKGFTGTLRGGSSPQNLKDWYILEHAEIATFAIVSRAAERLEYHDISRVAREAAGMHGRAAEVSASWFDYLVELMVATPSTTG